MADMKRMCRNRESMDEIDRERKVRRLIVKRVKEEAILYN